MNNIFVIYTGGTIGMVKELQTGTFIPFDFELIADNVPELKKLDYQLTVHSFTPIIDSSDMKTDTWVEMARLIAENYDRYDGFVILHGSDTMAFSASALSFMLEGLQKPVILSGSQLPIGEIRTDARENLITALELAAAKNTAGALIHEVGIFFDNRLFRGNRASKFDAAAFEAFHSPNYPVLVESGVHLKYNQDALLNHTGQEFRLHTNLDNSVAVLKLFPGISERAVRAVLDSGARSVIMETFGTGNTSTERWFLNALGSAIDAGTNVLNISQCAVGSVELGRYITSRGLMDIGVLNGYDMTFEAALTKLIFLQGLYTDQAAVAREVQRNLRGELSNPAE